MGRRIPDPLYGRIDVTPVQSLVDSPEFQRHNRISQLGGLRIVEPGATHTRFLHMLGTYAIATGRARALASKGTITDSEVLAVQITALLHDIGHRPFSHLIEPLVGDHNERGLELVRHRLKSLIVGLGADFSLVEQLMLRKHPLSTLISHTPLGADKLDYLARDTYFALGAGKIDVSSFWWELVGWDPKVGIYLDANSIIEYGRLLSIYWTAYAELYEQLSGRAAERYLQEIVRLALQRIKTLKRRLDDLGEDELLGAIRHWADRRPNRDHPCAIRYHKLAERKYPRKSLIFAAKPERIFIEPGSEYLALECDARLVSGSESWSLKQITEIEEQISALLGVPAWKVSVAPSPPRKRFTVPHTLTKAVDGSWQSVHSFAPWFELVARVMASTSLNIIVSLDEELRSRYWNDSGIHQTVGEILSSYVP